MRQRGFTLLELVVAIAVFGVMSLMAYGGLAGVLNSRAGIERNLDRIAALQKTYQRLREDLQQVQPRPARDGFGQAQPALLSATDDVTRVEFTRGGWRNPTNQERPTLERVSYRLDKNTLLRETWRVLDRAPDSKPARTELLDGVERLRWRFLDNGRQWQPRWPSVQAPTLDAIAASPAPLAVELTLETQDNGELRFLFHTGIGATPSGGAAAPPS